MQVLNIQYVVCCIANTDYVTRHHFNKVFTWSFVLYTHPLYTKIATNNTSYNEYTLLLLQCMHNVTKDDADLIIIYMYGSEILVMRLIKYPVIIIRYIQHPSIYGQ